MDGSVTPVEVQPTGRHLLGQSYQPCAPARAQDEPDDIGKSVLPGGRDRGGVEPVCVVQFCEAGMQCCYRSQSLAFGHLLPGEGIAQRVVHGLRPCDRHLPSLVYE
jgi:hypothetical protein